MLTYFNYHATACRITVSYGRIAVSYGRIGARLAIGVCLPVLEAESSVMELRVGADS